MRLFQRMSPEARFWAWFREHSERLLKFDVDQERLFDQIEAALDRVEQGLKFEFGSIQDGKRVFVVSADGVKDRFPAVRRLVAAAPSMPEWTVIPFRPPASIDLVIDYGGLRLAPDDVFFLAEPDRGRIGLTLYVKGLTDENEAALGSAGYILLDNALGEYAVETQVGFIEWKPLPEEAEESGLRPFRSIRELFDSVAH